MARETLDPKIRDEAVRRLKAGEHRVTVRDDLKLTQNQMSGICHRLKNPRPPIPPPAKPAEYDRKAVNGSTGAFGGWTEAILTEKWSDYTARRKAERAARRAAGETEGVAA